MNDKNVTLLCEAVFDISCMAQHLTEQHQIEVEDSRELFNSVLCWAKEFEADHPGNWDDPKCREDYIDEIDEFAEEKLRGAYGIMAVSRGEAELYIAVERKELEKLIDKYQKKADTAEATYQETGASRYYTTSWINQNMANALRIALSAKEDYETLREMRLVMSNFAARGAAAVSSLRSEDERVELAMRLAAEVADYGRRNGLN